MADIGGDLTVESLQNRSRTKDNSLGFSAGTSFGGDGSVTGANGGLNAANGMSVTKETVRSSLTSGGTANITVGGTTQITGATLATVDEEGNDLGQLTLTTSELNFTDLRDTHMSNQTSGSISTSVSLGGTSATEAEQGQTLAKDGKGREMTVNTSNLTYSNTSEYSAGNSLATLGTGTITVGGTLLEENGELTEAGTASDSPLAGLNRDTTDTTYELWDVERTEGNIDLQVDHRFFSEEGRQAIKNDFVDTGEFGQDIARSVNTVGDSENLGFLDFWETLDNTAKGTQIKNALVRDPANADILAGLASENGDEYAQAMQQLANLAQSTFGVELTELNFYDGEGTTNTGLADNVLVDIKGGTIMEGEGAGNMFIDGTDGADKKDMNNTLGHELIESVTAQTGGKNDAAQEDQATAFGSHFADRVDQAFEGGINATSTGAFTTSLINSNAVSTGTNAANAASGANIDNRKFSGMHAMQFGSYVRRQQANGAMDNADAGEMLTILQELSNNRGSLDLNNELNNLDPAALGVSQESIDAVRDLPVGVLGRIVQMEPSDSCEGTACYVIAEMADTMVNHEHMGDLAMEIGGGMLLDSVIDGYRAYKATKKFNDVDAVDMDVTVSTDMSLNDYRLYHNQRQGDAVVDFNEQGLTTTQEVTILNTNSGVRARADICVQGMPA